jgi:hypothetical protein
MCILPVETGERILLSIQSLKSIEKRINFHRWGKLGRPRISHRFIQFPDLVPGKCNCGGVIELC